MYDRKSVSLMLRVVEARRESVLRSRWGVGVW